MIYIYLWPYTFNTKILNSKTTYIFFDAILNVIQILVDGKWSRWGEWGTCTVSCGRGSQTRTRACNNPAPQNGGKECDSDGSFAEETRPCKEKDCPTGDSCNILQASFES